MLPSDFDEVEQEQTDEDLELSRRLSQASASNRDTPLSAPSGPSKIS
jgi:hypothetical protein